MMKVLCLFLCLGITAVYADDKVFVYDEHGKRDPFGPLVSPTGVVISYDTEMTATDMSLEGIVIDSKANNVAIMNGKIVKSGDQVGAYTVELISNDHVDLIRGQERLTVKLKRGAI